TSSSYWDISMLAALCQRGRIVALPYCLRSFRATPGSWGDRLHRQMSPFDLLFFSMGMRLGLIRLASLVPCSHSERTELLWLTIQNLFRANRQRPWDYQA